jgi:phosphoenolpyruvate synthase/pyruvate phosphate dikinase
VPHVVGTEDILAAIPRVWASPFSERAFAWRQGRMDRPEHVYPAVLLMRSVAADKSGVMVTQDVDNGDPAWLSIAVNEGVGGAVEGQAAEALRVHIGSGETRLMYQATAPTRRALAPAGGVVRLPASGDDAVLQPDEIVQLRRLARELPERFPPLRDAEGRRVAAEIEFGFADGQLQLFQIRPFLESSRARASQYLQTLDRRDEDFDAERLVALDEPPRKER